MNTHILPILSRTLAVAVAAMFALSVSSSLAQNQPPFRERYTKLEYMIPMRDGVKLYTAVYAPKNMPGKHPILMERTPYGAGPYGLDQYRGTRGSKKMQDAGYMFAWQDVRGRGHSEGMFVNDRPQLIVHNKPNDVDESTDTYDTIDYLVKHVPDNNGRVGLWGISYPGFYAGAGAINSHPALKAASPQAPVSGWFVGDDFHHNGALFLMDALGFARFGESEEVSKSHTFPSLNVGQDKYKWYLENGNPAQLTEKLTGTDGIWNDLLTHTTYDEYWQSRDLPHSMTNVHCAVMTVGGWFDAEDCWGALHTYKGAEAQNPRIYNTLVMGPWYHGMWAGGAGTKFGDMDWGQPTSTYFQDNIEFPFFDAFLRGNGKPKLPEAQVFETGANRWRSFPVWPPREVKQTAFYLRPGKALSTSVPTSQTSSDSYVSDPANPVPYQGGAIRNRTREYMIDDQRFATSRPDVLSYSSSVMDNDLTIAGPVQADLRFTSTSTDCDFVVKVIDVFPDDAPGKLAGYQMLVRAEIFRAKFRDSYQNPQPLTPGKVERLSYEMPDVLHTFKKGHKMMVQVQSSWFPLVDRNPQQFLNIYTAKPEDYKPATIQIRTSSSNPSSIRVGVLGK
jgi:putative CocE/NonD family hydrolase